MVAAALPAVAYGGAEARVGPQAAPPPRGQIVVLDENSDLTGSWWSLRVVPAAGGACRTVFRSPRPYGYGSPSVSPDGRLFAYRDGRSLVVRPVGGGQARVIPGAAGDVSWARDSRRLVFVDGYEIVVVEASGGQSTRVRPVPDGLVSLSDPELSPDGRFVAFVKHWTEGPDDELVNSIDVIRVDGVGGPRELYRGANAYSHIPAPSWSPDGRKLLFADEANLAAMAIFVVNVDGSGLRKLTNPKGGYGDSEPRWSPDGRRIAFTSSRHLPVQREEKPVYADVYVMNADGSRPRRITFTRPTWETVAVRGTVAGPWSPDGRMLALTHHRDVDIVRPDGTGRRKLCRASLHDTSHSLSPAAWRR